MAKRTKIKKPEVAAVFEGYPYAIKAKLLFLRQLIFDVASRTHGAGPLEEALRWGQPSYLTTQSQSGSPIRIDRIRDSNDQYAMYFHCRTTLVDTFKEMYRGQFEFEGNRSIVFHKDDEILVEELSHCISIALTYHLHKKPGKRASAGKDKTRRQFAAAHAVRQRVVRKED